MDDESRLTFAGPLQLATLDDQRFTVLGAELRIRPDQARLKFHVDAKGYAHMLERSLFGLLPLVRGDGALESGDIEVTAYLRPELLADLRDAEMAPELLAESLAETPRTGLLGALASTESWLATAIVAKLPETPPDLPGDISSGFQTAWSRDSLDPDPVPPLREMVEAFFVRHEWETQAIGDSLLCATIEGEDRTWRFLVRVDEAQGLCALSSVHPDQVPEARRAEVAAQLAAKNRDVDAGAFDIDMLDGEVRLRSTLFSGADGLPPAMFDRLAIANLETFEQHVGPLAALFAGS